LPKNTINYYVDNQTNNKIEVNNTTRLFRVPTLFKKMPSFINQKFPSGAKIYCYASSDGSEAYTIALNLLNELGEEESSKFFPLYASDVIPEIINNAQNGIIRMKDEEIHDFYKYTDLDFNKYFTQIDNEDTALQPDTDGKIRRTYKVNPALFEKVQFKCADITKDCKNKFEGPSVVLFRNALYLLENDKERIELVSNLSKNLDNGSLLILGKYDYIRFLQLGGILEANGFRKVKEFGKDSSLIFEKRTDNTVLSSFFVKCKITELKIECIFRKILKLKEITHENRHHSH